MPKPTPSPAPASGADKCHGCMNGYPVVRGIHQRDGVPMYVCTALYDEDEDAPTPPSDAGTSERETGIPPTCEHCGHLTDSEPISFSLTFGDRVYPMTCNHAAAPAAEGPRDDDRKCDVCGKWRGDSVHTACDAAALPGAEAGTPDKYVQAARAFDEEERKKLGEWVQANLQHHAGKSWSEGIAAEFAALTSEVRALREERDDWQESARIYVRSNRELRAQLRAARLASPSPTGAPSSPANPQEDETDAR